MFESHVKKSLFTLCVALIKIVIEDIVPNYVGLSYIIGAGGVPDVRAVGLWSRKGGHYVFVQTTIYNLYKATTHNEYLVYHMYLCFTKYIP